MLTTIKQSKRLTPFLMALLFLGLQVVSTLSLAIINSPSALAANNISVSTHQGQLNPAGSYTSGNITTYTELDKINFRFNLSSDAAASGKMQVEFTSNDTGCLFFDGSLALGTKTGGSALTSVTGTAPTVTLDGPATNNGADWVQKLNVNFAGVGSATVNYYLTLTNEAGECSSGSPQHSRLANVAGAEGGDFKNIGQQNVPIPSNQIIELPEIFVEKWVDTNADGQVDRKAAAGEWSFSLDGATPVPTDSNGNVVFSNVSPNGDHVVTEVNGPAGQIFLNGSGTNCKFNGSTATATVSSGTTSVDATCVFNNGTAPGSITIVKNSVQDNPQDFNFTSNILGYSSFKLDDEAGTSTDGVSESITFNNLTPGTYNFAELATEGWYLEGISCPNINETDDVSAGTLSLTIAAGQNITCTFENRQYGTVTVDKVTLPANDPTLFSVTISGSGDVVGDKTRNLSTTQSVSYQVKHGTYNVVEADIAGWSEDFSDCAGLQVSSTELNAQCTITNTKLSKLTFIKDALPNSAQDFTFSATGSGIDTFVLDDDSDSVKSNTQVFNGLMPGAYTVEENPVEGWDLASINCAGSGASYQTDGSLVSVRLSAGQDITCTFTNTQRGSISGYKFEDLNGNGVWDSGETVLSNWSIWIDINNDGDYDEGIDILTLTLDDGTYLFDSISAGTYSVFEILTDGWQQTLQPDDVVLEYGENQENVNFGNFEKAMLSGFKFNDRNGNASQDEGEEKMSGWTINLMYDGDDEDSLFDDLYESTQTNSDGNYSFSKVAMGSYEVCEVQQAGWVQTAPLNNGCHLVEVNQSGQETTDLYFGNQGRGRITVVKEVYPYNDPQDFNFSISSYEDEECYYEIALLEQSECYEVLNYVSDSSEFTLDDDQDETLSNTEVTELIPGQYVVSEESTEGWDLVDSYCQENKQEGGYEGASQTNGHIVTVYPGSDITCYFTNVKHGKITIVKDARPDSDQEFTFSHNFEGKASEDFSLVDDGQNPDTASKTFDVRPGEYGINEYKQENWRKADFSCDNEEVYEDSDLRSIDLVQTLDSYENMFDESIYVMPGQHVTCTFVNEATLAFLTKTNNKPNPTVVGDEVTYTLQLRVPEQAATVFDTTVIDLPPENFEYIPGSWTANSNVRGDLKAANITTEPTYASPGTWQLGNVVGGEVITLTYLANILSIVTPGAYPDIAFVAGIDQDEQEVLGNVTTADTPFVGTTVAVINPSAGKIFTPAQLANTGRSLSLLNAIVPTLLIGLTLLAYRRSRQYPKKGGQL